MIAKSFIKKATLLFAMIAGLAASPIMAQVPFDRGMKEKTVFVPKNQWIAGVSVSYSTESYDNYQFLVLENLNGNGYSFKVSPMAMFSFSNDLAAGGRFSYSRSLLKMDDLSVVLASDMDFNTENLYSLSHSYGFTCLFRNYIPLGNSKRFGLFNEVQLKFAGGQSKLASGAGKALSGTYSQNFDLGIGVTPGLVMFLNNYSAIEVNVGVLGFNYHNTRMVTDQIYVANMKRHSANFKINLFSITIGTVFYI